MSKTPKDPLGLNPGDKKEGKGKKIPGFVAISAEDSDPPVPPIEGRAGGSGTQGVSYVPPFMKPHGLTSEEVKEALTYKQQVETHEYEVNDNIICLVYQELKRTPDTLVSLDIWKEKVQNLHDEQGIYEIRRRRDPNIQLGDDPFVSQMKHFLKLCGLTPRFWEMIVGACTFDISEDDKRKISNMVKACRYQGFDPSIILKKLIRAHQHGRTTHIQYFNIEIEDDHGNATTWRYTSHESFLSDMYFLITVFLNRGSIVPKISKKSATDFADCLRMLVAKYAIRSEEQERRGRALAIAPDIVTLPRIAACFCQITVNMFHNGYGRIIYNISEFEEKFPIAMYSPMFPSVVRKGYRAGDGIINIHPQLVLLAILLDNVLHVRGRVTPLDQIWTYYLASYGSSVMTLAARIRQCDEYGVTYEGLFDVDILNMRQHCIQRIRDLRPHERIDDLLQEMNTIE